MRVFCYLSHYISHRKAALGYLKVLSLAGHEVTVDPAEADLAIIHDEPTNYPAILKAMPALKNIPKAGYCVWETEILPEAFFRGLSLMDKIWTCSDFSRAAFEPHFPGIRVLPHVVERLKPRQEDLRWVMEKLDLAPGKARPHLFYAITDSINPRKNLPGLLKAFVAAFPPNQDAPARLIVKQYRKALDLSAIPNVISIDEELEEGQLSALHALCDTLVSPHHAEAWGLTLSEAMSFGKLILATGYSGNLQFMNGNNSVLLPYTLVPVPEEMRKSSPLFTPAMHWAEPDPEALTLALRRAAANSFPQNLGEQARLDMRACAPAALAPLMNELLAELQQVTT